MGAPRHPDTTARHSTLFSLHTVVGGFGGVPRPGGTVPAMVISSLGTARLCIAPTAILLPLPAPQAHRQSPARAVDRRAPPSDANCCAADAPPARPPRRRLVRLQAPHVRDPHAVHHAPRTADPARLGNQAQRRVVQLPARHRHRRQQDVSRVPHRHPPVARLCEHRRVADDPYASILTSTSSDRLTILSRQPRARSAACLRSRPRCRPHPRSLLPPRRTMCPSRPRRATSSALQTSTSTASRPTSLRSSCSP
jgi:hypothetical protein